MNTISENITITDNRPPSTDLKQSPPAFLDLADSVSPLHHVPIPHSHLSVKGARRGTNLPDMSAVRLTTLSANTFLILILFQRVEMKRLEHEHQRAMQRRLFEDQMRALERKQAHELLALPYDANLHAGIQHLAVSAPTTPPRVNAILNGDVYPGSRSGRVQFTADAEILSKAVGSVADKRKSVTYAPSINISSELVGPASNGQSFIRPAGAKSMPASRRTSASSHDEELASHLQNLALAGEQSNRASPDPVGSVLLSNMRYGDEDGVRHPGAYNAGMMLDEQLDKEMHSKLLLVRCLRRLSYL